MSLYEPKYRWRTLHGDGKEILVNVMSILVLTEIEDGGTLITFENGIHMRVDEDIKEVKDVII